MLRKTALFVLFLLALLSAPALALDEIRSGSVGMARYFPPGADFFFSMRIDDAYVGELDAIIDKVIRQLPRELSVPSFSLAKELENIAIPNMSYAEFRAMFGDHLAFAVGDFTLLIDDDRRNDDDAPIMLAVEIRDRAAVENFVAGTNTNLARRSENDYTLFEDLSSNTYFAISDDLLYISSVAMLPPARAALLDDAEFSATLRALPAPAYNIVLYMDVRSLMSQTLQTLGSAVPRALQELYAQLGTLAIGLTILDGRSLVMDWSQQAPEIMQYPRIDPAFVRFAPAGTSAVIQAAGLSDQLRQVLDLLREAAREMDQRDPMLDVRAALAMLGLDLEEDLLSWMNGDYLAIAEVNFDSLLNAIAANDPSLLVPLPFDFGLIFEATDAARATNLVQKLTTALQNALAGQPEISVAPRSIANGALTEIKLAIPLGPQSNLTYVISLGATDEVFFFASEGVTNHILHGGPGVDRDAAYQEAARYFLPDMISLVYADGEGLFTTVAAITVPFLGLMGPAIGDVFEDIADELNQSSLPAPTRQTVQSAEEIEMIRLALRTLNRIITSSSISSSITDGFMVSRAIITLGE